MRDEFMITRQGKQYVLFAGLLDEAHARGLKGIDTDLVQVPTIENGSVAIVKATVEMEDGRTFSGIGDASPDNVGRMIAPHIVRMAETRAKARALRDAVNVGAGLLEELSDADEMTSTPAAGQPSGTAQGGRQSGRQSGRQGANRNGNQAPKNSPVQAVPDASQGTSQGADSGANLGDTAEASPSADDNQARATERRSTQKARKSQVDLLRTLAEELRGEHGVARLEDRIGKSLSELTRAEADEWIDRLTPAEGREAAGG